MRIYEYLVRIIICIPSILKKTLKRSIANMIAKYLEVRSPLMMIQLDFIVVLIVPLTGYGDYITRPLARILLLR